MSNGLKIMFNNFAIGVSFLLSMSQLSAVEPKAAPTGDDFLMQKVTGICTTGDAKRIARWCIEQVRNKIDGDRLDADVLEKKLGDADLERFCYLGRVVTI